MDSGFSFTAMKQMNRLMLWLEPQVEITYLRGFTSAEEKRIRQIIEANFEYFKEKWHEHFSK